MKGVLSSMNGIGPCSKIALNRANAAVQRGNVTSCGNSMDQPKL